MSKEDIIPAVMHQMKMGIRQDANMIMQAARDAERKQIYDQLVGEYESNHKLCPKCKTEGEYEQTCVGYPMDLNHPENYKDENKCTCSKCKDVHTKHERVKE